MKKRNTSFKSAIEIQYRAVWSIVKPRCEQAQWFEYTPAFTHR